MIYYGIVEFFEWMKFFIIKWNLKLCIKWNLKLYICCVVFCSGVLAVVDFVVMRDVVKRFGGDLEKINFICFVDFVIDYFI